MLSCLTYEYDANVSALHCQQHMCARSQEGVLREVDMWAPWLCDLISNNLEFGPRNDETRRQELRSALKRIYEKRTPDSVPMFMFLAPMIAEDLEDAGIAVFPRDRRIED